MIFQKVTGFGGEQAGAVDLCRPQHGDDLLLGDDELAALDEPEGGLVAHDGVDDLFSVPAVLMYCLPTIFCQPCLGAT